MAAEPEQKQEKIVVPTPLSSELLVRAGQVGPEYLDILNETAALETADFDQRAAVEVAAATRAAIDAGDNRAGSDSPWAKVKLDRQIIAIAKVEGASIIYSDDADIARFSKDSGTAVIRTCDLPLPPQEPQHSLPLDHAGDES